MIVQVYQKSSRSARCSMSRISAPVGDRPFVWLLYHDRDDFSSDVLGVSLIFPSMPFSDAKAAASSVFCTTAGLLPTACSTTRLAKAEWAPVVASDVE